MAFTSLPAYLAPLKTPPSKPKIKNHTTGELHPRNLHRAPYDFPRLTTALPDLARFVQPHPLAGDTIDFADPAAVLALNRALLKLHYSIAHWDLPPGFLCPPVPSRVDYLHHLSDLLAADTANNAIPRGPAVRALDLGTGANAIYALLAASVFGWRVTGTDIDPASINWARQLAASNPPLTPLLDFRLQPDPSALFANIATASDSFAVSLCNPPFHASAAEAAAGTLRKIRNLGSPAARSSAKFALNFGGRANELWCPGGEAAFIRRMIAESATRPALCVWFTTLVSKRASLPLLERDLLRARATDVRIIPMFAGQKQSRLLAWTFLAPAERRQHLTPR